MEAVSNYSKSSMLNLNNSHCIMTFTKSKNTLLYQSLYYSIRLNEDITITILQTRGLQNVLWVKKKINVGYSSVAGISAVKNEYTVNHCTFYRQRSLNSRKLPLGHKMLNCYDMCRKIYLSIYVLFIYNEGDEWCHVIDCQPAKSL